MIARYLSLFGAAIALFLASQPAATGQTAAPAAAAPRRVVVHAGRLVPTVLAGKTVEAMAKIPGHLHPTVQPKAAKIGPLMQAMAGRAYKGGVKIAFGTDSGVSNHGENAREFAYLVEAGIPAMDAILMATRNAADLLGASDRIGSIQAGRFADVIAVAGDPLKDITELQRVTFVMKGGQVVKSQAPARPSGTAFARVGEVDAGLGLAKRAKTALQGNSARADIE